MHLGFALQSGNTLAKCASIISNRLSQRLVTVKNRSKTERQHGPLAEANAYHPGVLKHMLVIEIGGASVKLADNYRKFAAGIAEDGRAVHSLNAFNNERTASAGSVGLILV